MWMTSSRPCGRSDSAFAQRRSATDNPRGPNPTIASCSFSVNTNSPDLCDAAQAAAECSRHRSEPAHQVGELLWADRLGAVTQRLLRLDVDIDQ